MKPKSSLCALIVAALLLAAFANVATAAPADSARPLASPGYTFYTVQPRDNLYRISLRFGVSMYAIMQANGLTNANYVYAGQVLRIPTGPQHPYVPQPNHWIPAPYPCNSCLPPTQRPCDTCNCQLCDTAWTGTYFDDMFLQGPDFTSTDAAIDFNWGNKSPGGQVPKAFWSARWTKRASFGAGMYRFHAIVDDGVRLFVDGGVVIDEWEDNPGTEFIHDKYMTAGSHDLKVEYYQKAYDAKIKVWWEKL